jgi:chaperone BCS1
LAAKFGMSIYVINLTEFNDRTLRSAVTDVPRHSVILFEDIDCMKTGNTRSRVDDRARPAIVTDEETKKDASDQFGVTLSGLLNVLDGFNAPDNVLFVMTTNRIEVLDEALLRPGRIDYKLFLGAATESQKIELYRKFFPESSRLEAREFVEGNSGAETMAEFQGLLLGLEHEEDSQGVELVRR